MQGRILNRSLLQTVSRWLGLEGVKQFPAVLDLTDIKAVLDIGRFAAQATPTAEGTSRIDETGNIDLDGEDSFLKNIIENENADFTSEVGRRVDAMCAVVTFDAAGTAAMNGKQVEIEWGYNFDGGDPGLSVPICIIRSAIASTAAGGTLAYKFPLRGAFNCQPGAGVPFAIASTWNGRIPAHTAFYIRVTSVDGTPFPAETQLNNFICWRWSDNEVPPVE